MKDRFVQDSSFAESIATSVLIRVKSNDQAAWCEFVELYGPMIYWWCRSATLQDSDAKNVGQQVFQTVAKKIGKFERERGKQSCRAWLRTITKNKIIDFAREQKRKNREKVEYDWDRVAELAAADPDEQSLAVEVRILYETVLEFVKSEFKDRDRTIFMKLILEGHTPKEVSEAHGIKVANVHLIKSRMLARIRERFPDAVVEMPDPPPTHGQEP